MDEFVTRIREDQWAKIISECNSREPGMTKRAWCEVNGVNLKSFYYHQRRLRNQIAIGAVSGVSNGRASGFLPAPSSFADITEHVSLQHASAIPASDQDDHAQSIAPELMIQVSNYRILVSSSVKESTLETVLRAINHA